MKMNQDYRCVVYPSYHDSILVTGLGETGQKGGNGLSVTLPHFTVTAHASNFQSLDTFVRSVKDLMGLSSGVYGITPPAEGKSPLEMAYAELSHHAALEVGTINCNAESFPLMDPSLEIGSDATSPHKNTPGYLIRPSGSNQSDASVLQTLFENLLERPLR